MRKLLELLDNAPSVGSIEKECGMSSSSSSLLFTVPSWKSSSVCLTASSPLASNAAPLSASDCIWGSEIIVAAI